MWHLKLLSSFSLTGVDQETIQTTRSSARLLLAYLATQNAPVRREVISAHIFQEVENREEASNQLRVALFSLNQALPGTDEEAPIFKKSKNTLLLNRSVFRCDLWEFQENILASAKTSETGVRISLLENAVGLYEGVFSWDGQIDWLTQFQSEIETQFLNALSCLITLLSSQERWQEVQHYQTLYLAHDPYDAPMQLQHEQLHHLLSGGEDYKAPVPLIWNQNDPSQKGSQQQFQTLMMALSERGEAFHPLASESRSIELAVLWCLRSLPQGSAELARGLAGLPSPLSREDALVLFGLTEPIFVKQFAPLLEARLVALRAEAFQMSPSIKKALLKTASPTEISSIRAKHASRFTGLAKSWVEHSPLPTEERTDWIKNNISHLCGALEWAIEHLPEVTENLFPLFAAVEEFLPTHPILPKLPYFTDRILERIETLPVSQQFKLSVYIATQMCRYQYRDKIKAPLERALRLLNDSDEMKSDPSWAHSLISLGYALHHGGGEPHATEEVLRAALPYFEKEGKWADLSKGYFNLSECLWSQGRLRETQDCLRKSLAFLERSGIRDGREGICWKNLGALELTFGHPEKAKPLLEKAHAVLKQNFSEMSCISILDTIGYLGAVQTQEGNFETAEVLLEHSKRRCDELKRPANGMRVTLALGENARAQGQYAKAEAHYGEALQFWREYPSPSWTAITLADLAELHLENGSKREAGICADEVLEICGETRGRSSRARALYVKGILSLERGDGEKAECFLEEAEALRQFVGTPMKFLPEQVQEVLRKREFAVKISASSQNHSPVNCP